MNTDNQKPLITNSLRLITDVFSKCKTEYRVVGSVLIVAYKQKIFRHINDVDVLIDGKTAECVFKELKNKGFVFKERHWTSFIWWEAERENYLGYTFLLIGKFTKDYFSYTPFAGCELRIKRDYLSKTEYQFNDVKFIGVPISSAIAGIKQAFLNPKRSLDKQILKEEIKKVKNSPYGNIVVYLGGIKIPFLYDIFSFFYNIYGGFRIIFGRKYEAWE